MRWILMLVMVMACGSQPAQPRPQPIRQQTASSPKRAPDVREDPRILKKKEPAPMVEYVVNPDGESSDEPPETPEPTPDAKREEALDKELGVRVVDGLRVAPSRRPVWCADDLCWATKNECTKARGRGCTPASAYACFFATMTVSGERRRLCSTSMAVCGAFSAEFSSSSDTSSVSTCIVFRPKP